MVCAYFILVTQCVRVLMLFLCTFLLPYGLMLFLCIVLGRVNEAVDRKEVEGLS